MTEPLRLLALVLPLVPLPIDVPFPRQRWPAHLTALSNFRTRLHDDEVQEVVRPVLSGFGPVEGHVGAEALFGAERDIPVRLIESPQVLALHAALLEAIEPLAELELPAHQGPGFRPHVTLVPDLPLEVGAPLRLPTIALAVMRGPDATVAWQRPL